MAKVNKKKSSKAGKRENKSNHPNRAEAKLLLGRGEVFGDAIIWIMLLFALDVKGMGIAAIGLAKALAALKSVAKCTGVNIDNLFESELTFYEDKLDLSSKGGDVK